jgi:hypothetical protein
MTPLAALCTLMAYGVFLREASGVSRSVLDFPLTASFR